MPEDDAISPDPDTQTTVAEDAAAREGAGEKTVKIEEGTSVIDVHAPHGGVHTWKDFWIHLGTIAAGLLIAISLEQSVEALHRLHERHQLEDDLRHEGLHNKDHARVDIAIYDHVEAWLLEIQRGVDVARVKGGGTGFVYPARPDGIPDSPRLTAYQILESEAWSTAKEGSMLTLLPRDEAEIYTRLSFQADQVDSTRDRAREIGMRQGGFETRFSSGVYPPVLDIARLSPAQLDEYEGILADELEAVRVARVRLRIFAAANDYVLGGGTNAGDLRKSILKANVSQ